MDTAILALQLTMLALVVSKQDQDEAHALREQHRTTSTAQDLESEERGEVRRYSVSSESSNNDDESDGRAATGQGRLLETETLLTNGEEPVADGDEPRRDRERRVCEITSGEFMAAELKVIDVVKKQWRKGAIRSGEAAHSGSVATDTGSEGTRRV